MEPSKIDAEGAPDLKAAWIAEMDRAAVERRYGILCLALGTMHLAFFTACQLEAWIVGAEPRWVFPLLWLIEVIATFIIARIVAGKGWFWGPPISALVARVWCTYLILAFSLSTLNHVSGWEHDWFKPVWGTLGTFGFAIMAWLFSAWFFIPAVQMWLTGLLMVRFPHYGFLIQGGSMWLALTVIGIVLERRRRLLVMMDPELTEAAP